MNFVWRGLVVSRLFGYLGLLLGFNLVERENSWFNEFSSFGVRLDNFGQNVSKSFFNFLTFTV